MSESPSPETELGIDKPVEDVLEQRRGDEEEPPEPGPSGDGPGEVDEADYRDQHLEVPLEDDRYPSGGASG